MMSHSPALNPGDKLTPGSFGFAGSDTWDELSSRPGKMGIVRDVRVDEDGSTVSGVDYELTNAKLKLAYRWLPTSTPGRWELDLAISRDPQSQHQYTSLSALANRIRSRFRRSGRLPAED